MSQTMSSPTEWVQFYQQNLSAHVVPPGGGVTSGTMFSDRVSDATIVTTTATTPTPLGLGQSSPSSTHLSPDGRVSKPIRRRSRASRRTPTTLLNTDTNNFRAMVQQFTGGPSAPFASAMHPGAPNFGYGLGGRQAHVNPPSAIMVPPGYHLQYQQQQQQQQYQQQNQQEYMFSVGNSNSGSGGGGGGHDAFLERIGGYGRRPSMEQASNGFVMEGVSSQVPAPSRPPSSSNGNRNSNAFMF